MYQANTALHLILDNFEKLGWRVDYSTLTFSANLFSYMKRTDVFIFGAFSESKGIFTLTCDVNNRYPFCVDSLVFLEHMKVDLKSMGVDFTIKPPARFYFSWDVKYINSPLSPVKNNVTELVYGKIGQVQRFAFSCAHAVNAYGRKQQRNRSTRTEDHMYPEALSVFCLPELNEEGCNYFN